MTSTLRVGLTVAALAAASLLAACSSQPAPPPPPPPPPPVSALPASLVERASAYRYYVDHATAISPAFTDGAAVADAVRVGVAYEPKQLIQGATAYGAVVALGDPAFVAGVRSYGTNPDARRNIAYEIMKDPAYVVALTGSSSAAGLVMAALGDDGNKFYTAGKAVKQSAYDVQKQPWSKAEVPNRDVRLLQAKSLSTTPLVGEVAQTVRLQQAAAGVQPLGLVAAPASAPYTPTVIRSLAIAALAVLGHASDANMEIINAMMVEPNTGSCINMSKLNLFQCLAVSKPHYEDVFCLGQHAMMDTARCVIKASGQVEPFEPRFVPVARTAAEMAKQPYKTSTQKR
ncbi:hypothetical protein M9M90_17340 [Phenylobacterium sp. LH3H17]|uniref:hypothetical protein n=1 Tax=Phenylobacterium sp. LH3H17 TaxID=2903901 RepID=UPI0020C965C3|nr:hypothetical protein [Phenylobacterium sp. LH3H17]UTP38968.1 hypothetical protein M9M90_17340 [Phenylobacterium sp. LH3H17]